MESDLTRWVKTQLKQRHWSLRELARQSGVSHPLISQVLSGKVPPSVNFCYRIARAFGESPETLMRLAGLSAPMPDLGDQLIEEITEESKQLQNDERKQVLDFIRFLKRKGQ